MLRVMTANLNGIRSAARKGFFDWFLNQNVDVLCVQETKAQMQHLEDRYFGLDGYELFYADALKKGYSGVAIYTRIKPDHVSYGMDLEWADQEGRHVRVDIGSLSIVSVYLPSGTSGQVRQDLKFQCMDHYQKEYLNGWVADGRRYILCGDWNIAHREIDLKNWRQNKKNSGFLPEERAWLDHLFDERGWVDAFRLRNQEPEQYTWWSQRGSARANHVGWRIDYQIISPNLAECVGEVAIHPKPIFSDHAPLVVDYIL